MEPLPDKQFHFVTGHSSRPTHSRRDITVLAFFSIQTLLALSVCYSAEGRLPLLSLNQLNAELLLVVSILAGCLDLVATIHTQLAIYTHPENSGRRTSTSLVACVFVLGIVTTSLSPALRLNSCVQLCAVIFLLRVSLYLCYEFVEEKRASCPVNYEDIRTTSRGKIGKKSESRLDGIQKSFIDMEIPEVGDLNDSGFVGLLAWIGLPQVRLLKSREDLNLMKMIPCPQFFKVGGVLVTQVSGFGTEVYGVARQSGALPFVHDF